MTLELYPVPESVESEDYELSVEAAPVGVYATAGTSIGPTSKWATGALITPSYATIGRTEGFILRISKVSGAISSFLLLPSNARDDLSAGITGGDILCAIPASGIPSIVVIVDDDWSKPVVVKFNPIDPTLPVGAINFADSEITGVLPGQTVYFPPGRHTLNPAQGDDTPSRFYIRSGGRVIVQGGAFLDGSFDITQPGGAPISSITIEGNGVLSGEYKDAEVAVAEEWEDAQRWAAIVATDFVNYSWKTVALKQLTIVKPAWYCNTGGLTTIEDVCFLNLWQWGIAGPSAYKDGTTGLANVKRCFAWNFDDTFFANSWNGPIALRENCFAITAGGAAFDLGYWPGLPGSTTTTDCTSMSIGERSLIYGTPAYRYHASVARFWMSGTEAEASLQSQPIVFNNHRMDGDSTVPIIEFANVDHLFNNLRGSAGQIANVTFNGLVVEYAPTITVAPVKPIYIHGRDAISTPHDIHFNDVVIGGVPLTVENFFDYADVNEFPYNIFVDGDPVFDTEDPTLESIVVTPDPDANPYVEVGQSVQFAAVGTYSDDSTQNLTGAVTWSSTVPTVATVSNAELTKGLVAALDDGTTTITAFHVGTGVSGSAVLKVYPVDEDPVEDTDFVVEDGTGLDDAVSYCTVLFANTYHAARGAPAAWTAATQSARETALLLATQALDDAYGTRWVGLRSTAEQALEWPRTGATDTIGTSLDETVPLALKRATALYALYHVQGETLIPATQTGAPVRSESLSSASGASKSVTYAGTKRPETQFPTVERALMVAGLIQGGGGWGFLQ
jgi:hypothetical protein